VALNRLGAELDDRRAPPSRAVTMPAINLEDIDDATIEAEANEAMARVAERRVIRRGLDAWSKSAGPEASTSGKPSVPL
jgi:hypothetical protein